MVKPSIFIGLQALEKSGMELQLLAFAAEAVVD